MSKTKEEKVETGQVYVIKDDSKHKALPKAKTIKIGPYFKEGEKKHKLKNIWEILVKDDGGEWISPEKPLLFGQQIEAHYKLEFEPLAQTTSRLSNIED